MLKNIEKFSLPEVEEKVLEYWRKNHIFEASLKKRKGKKKFIFYEGPPYANGKPGIHHVLARVFKDIILRYKSMRGYYVPRRAGWDTHGLPIEIATEKELGLKSKKDIEKIGVAAFNKKAREIIWRCKDEWEKMTERIGYWLDLKNAYITCTTSYIEGLWWVAKEASRRGFLKKSYKVVPYCPRCETVLSANELGAPDVYKKVPDPSVYVKFKVGNQKSEVGRQRSENKDNEYFLAWTTTPWTLPANVGLAVNSEVTYTKYKVGNEYVWSANEPPTVQGVVPQAIETKKGSDLIGKTYEPLFPEIKVSKNLKPYRVMAGDFVSTEEGTGMVHVSPAFGDDDFKLVQKENPKFDMREIPITIDDRGAVVEGLPGAGKFIKDADTDLLDELIKRGKIYTYGTLEHDYPFCWRCKMPLMYMARSSWFFEMSKLRDTMLKENKNINWIPNYLRDGRFGDWLSEGKDWAISRERFWGTPLPIWECEKCGKITVLDGLKDLKMEAIKKNEFIFIRHGEADHNVQGYCGPSEDTKEYTSHLTEKGKAQIEKVARDLRNKKIDLILASPLSRMKETVAIIKEHVKAPVEYLDALKDINNGKLMTVIEWHNLTRDKEHDLSVRLQNGESRHDVKKRIAKILHDIHGKYEGKTILIATHGEVLWMFRAVLEGLSDEDAVNAPYPEPGKIYDFDWAPVPFNNEGVLDLHRPFVDLIEIKCEHCGGKVRRIKEVADVWFDSGAMPFASQGFPKNKRIDFPADYICEGLDQTRGWFYTLLAVSALVGKKAPYKNVISLGLILDKAGRKMSKSLGNVVEPWAIINTYGVDVVRWYFYTVNPPAEPKLFNEADLRTVANNFFTPLYNSFVFLNTYGGNAKRTTTESKNILDWWVIARLRETVSIATNNLEKYDVGTAAREIERFIGDVSRWYIRRSRRRFQKPESEKDYNDACEVLSHILRETSKLIAPFTPFFAEALYQSFGKAEGKELSVHCDEWPYSRSWKRDAGNRKLIEQMEAVRAAASIGLAKRAELGVKVRQPLASLTLRDVQLKGVDDFLEILKDEVNVKEVLFDPKLKDEVVLDTNITPELREEGIVREFVRTVQGLRQDAGYKPGELMALFVDAKSARPVLAKNEAILKKETGARAIEWKRTDKFNAELSTKFEGEDIWLAVRK